MKNSSKSLLSSVNDIFDFSMSAKGHLRLDEVSLVN